MKKLLTIATCLFLGINILFAQNKEVSGTVYDEQGEPVVGASVIVNGSSNIGTVTDIDGNFSLLVPNTAETLTISFIGMEEMQVKVQDKISAVLKNTSLELDEVVVTAMGIPREKKALGYAATSIKAEDIALAQTANPMTAISAKVAGVDVSGAPGMGSTQNVIIRGFSSLSNNQPLYIVDGVPITNGQNTSGNALNFQVDFGSGINALNPDNIEDMTILKGAAATALYGSRAANGVVMITTKSGQNTKGRMRVSYDGSVGMMNVGRLPMEQTMFGQGWSGDRALDENGSWGSRFDGKDRLWGNEVDGAQQLKKYSYLNNRLRDFFDYGIGYKNAVSLSGGNDKTAFHLSLSQNSADGVIPTNADAYDRYTIGLNASHKGNHLSASTSVNISSEQNNAVPSGQGASLIRSLYEIPTDISIVDMKDYKGKYYNLNNYFTPYGLNPYYVLNEDAATQNKFKAFGKFQIDYRIWKSLTLTYRFGGDYETSLSETHQSIVSFDPNTPNASSTSARSGEYVQTSTQRVQLNQDLYLSYNDKWGDFSFNGILGWNQNRNMFKRLRGTAQGLDIPNFYHLSNTLSVPKAEQRSSDRLLNGVYLNADLGFRDYLYLTLTARNDWSSTLPLNANSYFYPGATISFILSELLKSENINTSVLDFMKIRLAFGQTGNDTDPYYVYEKYSTANVAFPNYPNVDDLEFPIGGVNAYTLNNMLANPKLKPEITTEFEVGLEMNFFKNRIGFDISYYNKNTVNQIAELDIDPASGSTYRMANLGDIRNQGVELAVNLTPVKVGKFKWDLTYNFSKNYNKVLRLEQPEVYIDGFSGMGIYAVEGKAIGQFKSAVTKTVDIDGQKYTVVNGSGMPTATKDEEYLNKDINEKFRMGMTNTFSWNGISLSATLDFRYGGYIYSNTKSYMNWIGSDPVTVMNNRNPFLVPNSVVTDINGDLVGSDGIKYSINTTPIDVTELHTFYSNGGFQQNDAFLLDRSYLKLRDVSLSYALPKKYLDKIKLTGLRFSLNASNILLWTPKQNVYIDPETTTYGTDIKAKFGEFNANPTNQVYTFGLHVSF